MIHKILTQESSFDIFNYLPSSLVIIDRNFKIHYTNETFRSVFFVNEEELSDFNFGNVLGCAYSIEDKKECLISPLCEFCELKKDIISAFDENTDTFRKFFSRWFYIQEEKRQKHFQYTIKHIKQSGEEFVLIILLDLTELFVKSEQLQKAINEKNVLLGMAAHDLRTPIAGARTYLDLMVQQKNSELTIDLKDSLIQISNNLDIALNLINDTLDVTALELGTIELTQQKQDYTEFIREVYVKNVSFALKKHINIKLNIQDELEVFFDRARLTQVMDNLISNAIKYSPSGTEILIKVYRQSSTIMTEIHDQEAGIAEEEIPLIFDYFHRTTFSKANNVEGTGLGLAIVKKIVRKHRGEVYVESQVGKGSVFCFSLPI